MFERDRIFRPLHPHSRNLCGKSATTGAAYNRLVIDCTVNHVFAVRSNDESAGGFNMIPLVGERQK